MLISIAALAEINKNPSLLQPIEKSLKKAFEAIQIYDDLQDWKSDLEQHHVTYVLTQLVPDDALNSEHWPGVDKVEESINASWKDVDLYTMGITRINQAKDAVENIQCPQWLSYLDSYSESFKRDQQACMANRLKQAIKPLVGDSV
jgi:hypothetical protein